EAGALDTVFVDATTKPIDVKANDVRAMNRRDVPIYELSSRIEATEPAAESETVKGAGTARTTTGKVQVEKFTDPVNTSDLLAGVSPGGSFSYRGFTAGNQRAASSS